MGMNPKSIAKIYTQVKGTKFYYDVLIENRKKVPTAVVNGEQSYEKEKTGKPASREQRNYKM